MEQEQKQYECIFILSPHLEGADLDKVKGEIGDLIAKLGGTISFKESEKRTLAYPINKQGQGIFLITQVSILPENIANLSSQLKLNKQILRHIINQLEVPKIEVGRSKPIKKEKTKKKEPSFAPTKVEAGKGKTNLEEIDKKLDELIDKI